MKPQIHASTRLARVFALPALLGCLSSAGLAVDGSWNTTSSGNWIDTANWLNGTVAGGTDAIATFNTAIAGTRTITVDAGRTVGTLNLQGNQQWQLTGGALTLATSAGTPTINSTGSGFHFINVNLSGSQGFTKIGSGVLILRAANSYSGVTTLSNGQLYVRTGGSLGASGAGNETVVAASTTSAQLHFDGTSGAFTSPEDIILRRATSGESNSIYNDNATNAVTLTGAITLERGGVSSAAHTFGVQGTAGTLTLNGAITGQLAAGATQAASANGNVFRIRATAATANVSVGGVISDGTIGANGLSFATATDHAGYARLSGANTYSGGTTHNKGTLLINNTAGSGTGTGSVLVASTAVFGGTGIIAPTGASGVSFASGSVVSPGDMTAAGAAIDEGRTLTFDLGSTTGGVTFAGGATISLNLNASGPSTLVESLAFIGLTGGVSDVVFNGNTVNFSIVGTLADGLYTLATFDAGGAYAGTLGFGTGLEAYATKSFVYGADRIQLQIGAAAIPEPATAAILGGLAVLGCGVIRRRK